MIGPTYPKNSLTFGGDLVSDTDPDHFFHFPHHCGMWDFRRFISISLFSHTVTFDIFLICYLFNMTKEFLCDVVECSVQNYVINR